MKMGRPVGSKYTDEEKAERARLSAMRRYYNNIEKERERYILEYHANKQLLKPFLHFRPMHVYIYIYIYIYIYVYMYVCMYVCGYIYIYIYM